MARRRSQAEQTMLKINEKAKAQVYERYEGVDEVLDIIHSWSGLDLILDVKLKDEGWVRLIYIVEDDTELAGMGTTR